MKRRDFFKQTGLMLAALGLTEAGLTTWASQVLAQPARRKLALLVGINAYPATVRATAEPKAALNGCVNDVALQRELLIHRFGFQPTDILTLTDRAATANGIVEAFIQHLYQQAQPEDAVILHFSGYGSTLQLTNQSARLRSWVPVDGQLPTEAVPRFNDLPEAVIKQLLKSLRTKQVTTILDAGFNQTEMILSTSLKSRSRSGLPIADGFQSLPVLATVLNSVVKPDEPAPWPGVLLRAAAPEGLVGERAWDGFSAGLFTYALTQYLWTTIPATTVQIVMERTREGVGQRLPPQSPQLAGQRQAEITQPYGLPFVEQSQTDGVVVAIAPDKRSADIWLGGLSAEVVQYSGDQSWVSPLDTTGNLGSPVQIRSRTGLMAKVRLSEADGQWQLGQGICETTRVLPRSINLTVALDNQLERIERVDATSALAALHFVSAITPEDQPADCLFGKSLSMPVATLAAAADLPVTEPVKQGYGLFSSTRELLPDTLAKQDEAVKVAISRLTPKLRSLLALKLLRLTVNDTSSQLAVRANLEMVTPQEKLLLQSETVRSQISLPTSRPATLISREDVPLTIATGSRLRYRLFNFSDQPLYFMHLSQDVQERLSIFLPPDFVQEAHPPLTNLDPSLPESLTLALPQLTIPAREAITLPQGDISWRVEGSKGRIETFTIFSTAPFTETLTLLAPLSRSTSSQRLNLSDNALEVVQAILSDLDHASSSSSSATDAYSLSVAHWGTLQMSFYSI